MVNIWYQGFLPVLSVPSYYFIAQIYSIARQRLGSINIHVIDSHVWIDQKYDLVIVIFSHSQLTNFHRLVKQPVISWSSEVQI